MNVIHTVRRFRHDLYDCFEKAKGTLFNTVDALLTETSAKSFPELSQSVWFERKWPSLYKAFEDGRINESRLREVFASYLSKSENSNWLWLGSMQVRLHVPMPSRRQIVRPNMSIIFG